MQPGCMGVPPGRDAEFFDFDHLCCEAGSGSVSELGFLAVNSFRFLLLLLFLFHA